MHKLTGNVTWHEPYVIDGQQILDGWYRADLRCPVDGMHQTSTFAWDGQDFTTRCTGCSAYVDLPKWAS